MTARRHPQRALPLRMPRTRAWTPPPPLEREEQRGILSMAALCFPNLLVHHSPNQMNKRGWAGKMAAARNKADGVKTGYPDLTFIGAGFIAFAEVKRRWGQLSEPQKVMIDLLAGWGFPVAVLRSPEQAYWWLRDIGAPWNGVRFVPDDARPA